MEHKFAIGDLLSRPKMLGFVRHVGVVVAPGAVLQNSREKGEHLTTFAEFSAGEQVQVHRTGANPASVLARVRKILSAPKRYDPIFRNCEHTANEAVYGFPSSRQLLIGALFAVLLLLVWFLSRRS